MSELHKEDALSLSNRIAHLYGQLSQVEAVALAGSHTTQRAEPTSDVDLYVYASTEIPLEAREAIAYDSSIEAEVDNQFWEPGDEWKDISTGIHVDVMFRSTRWIEEQLERVLDHQKASVGYTTCLWHNVRTSKLLVDKSGWFAALQKKANQPYPSKLCQAIVAKNHPILRDSNSSYFSQIQKAYQRGDSVSVNHRLAAFLASYFDIIFAVNKLPHPGEKRLLNITEAECKIVPVGMRNQIMKLLEDGWESDRTLTQLNLLIDGLDEVLQREGLLR